MYGIKTLATSFEALLNLPQRSHLFLKTSLEKSHRHCVAQLLMMKNKFKEKEDWVTTMKIKIFAAGCVAFLFICVQISGELQP